MIGETVERFGDLVAEQASRTFAGRKQELSQLMELLGNQGPAVIYLHGIAGIGKSRLISAFAERAHGHATEVMVLDCCSIEPTEQGFLQAIGSRFGRNSASLEDTVAALANAGARVVFALDSH